MFCVFYNISLPNFEILLRLKPECPEKLRTFGRALTDSFQINGTSEVKGSDDCVSMTAAKKFTLNTRVLDHNQQTLSIPLVRAGATGGVEGGGQKSYSEVQSAEPLTESVKKHMNEFYNNEFYNNFFNLLNKFFGKVFFLN